MYLKVHGSISRTYLVSMKKNHFKLVFSVNTVHVLSSLSHYMYVWVVVVVRIVVVSSSSSVVVDKR